MDDSTIQQHCCLAAVFDVDVDPFQKKKKRRSMMVMQETSDALSKTADSDTVSTYQVSSVQLVTDKKLEAFNKA